MAGSISRVTLPSEFFDRTSELVLRQPTDEFLYAKLLFGACARAELSRVGAEAFPGYAPSGAAYPALADMQAALADPIRSAAITVTDELQPGKIGHTLRMNRPIFSGGGYTLAARQFQGNLSLNPINVSDEGVSITIGKFAGPYSAAGSEVQPYAISRHDALHSVHSLVDKVGAHLAYDRNKFVDSVFALYFDSGVTPIFPGDSSGLLTTDAGAWPVVPVGSSRPMDLETILRMEEELQEAKIPRFDNGRYMCFLTPKQWRQLLSDRAYQSQSQFLQEKNLLSPGGVGALVVNGSIELYKCNTNVIDTTTVAGVSINHGVMFGPGAVGYADAGGCRVAPASENNYGEDQKVVWIAYEGSAVLDNRFTVSAHSD